MISASEGHIAKMAILGMSCSNFYSAQNTFSRCQITLEIEKTNSFWHFVLTIFRLLYLKKIFWGHFFESHFLGKFPLQILCKILVRISLKMWKIAKIVNFQTQITFYLRMRRQKRKYEFVSEFYELFENHHHLSDLLN